MKPRSVFVGMGLSIAGLLLADSLPAHARADRTAQNGATRFAVRGFVVDADDRPVAGATVSLEGIGVAAQTDSIGGFSLQGIPRGSHRVTARVGCVMVGHIDAMEVPRPVRMPLPIRLKRVDCALRARLDPAAEREILSLSLRWFTDSERRAITSALGRDGAIRILDGGNVTIDDVELVPGVDLPVEHRGSGEEFPEAIWISVCITTTDDRSALVRLVRTSPPVPEELDVFVGDAALVTFGREGLAEPWTLLRGLVCVDAPPPIDPAAEIDRPSANGDAQDPASSHGTRN